MNARRSYVHTFVQLRTAHLHSATQPTDHYPKHVSFPLWKAQLIPRSLFKSILHPARFSPLSYRSDFPTPTPILPSFLSIIAKIYHRLLYPPRESVRFNSPISFSLRKNKDSCPFREKIRSPLSIVRFLSARMISLAKRMFFLLARNTDAASYRPRTG